MILDNEFDIAYFSEYLRNPLSGKDREYARIFTDLENILRKHSYKAQIIPYKEKLTMSGQLSVWCRDYMSVPVTSGHAISFKYEPDYLQCKKYKDHQPDNRWLNLGYSLDHSDIKLDGGNIVRCGDKVVMVDKVLYENSLSPRKILDTMENLFEAEIILLPWDTRDYLGHSDGILRYIGNHQVVMPTYQYPSRNRLDRRFDETYRWILEQHGLSVQTIDFSGNSTENSPFHWAYVNWLQLKDLIIIPIFRDYPETNEQALKQIRKYLQGSGISIETVEATALAQNDGALNCASWTTCESMFIK